MRSFLRRTSPLKILFVASEAAPFAKVGGLGEVMFSLPRALRRLGHDVRVMVPRYATIDAEKFPMAMVKEGLEVPSGGDKPLVCNVKMFEPGEGEDGVPAPAYFLENEEYYEQRANVYGYDDDMVRWALLSRGVLEFLRGYKEWQPDIIVASDWQSGLIPNYLHAEYKDDAVLSKIAVVFSIHNLSYQGTFDHHFVSEMDYDDGKSEIPGFYDPRLMKINYMRRGIMYADVINTVSPTYAKEITTKEYGELLNNLLQERRARLFGILNGIDYTTYNPETNPLIEYGYNAKRISERAKNKSILRQRFNLPEKDGAFVLGVVSRLSEQKGIDLIMETIEPLLENFNAQLVVLGTGESRYLSFFQELDKKYESVAAHLSYDNALPHLIYAGADAILIPSRFEPSGLTQMEAMRYGAVPIVRKTGGLADSVEDYDPEQQTGTGFVFDRYDRHAFFGTMIRAFETYRYPNFWQGIQTRAMRADFSWDKSAGEYVKLFEKAVRFHAEGNA